MMYQLELGTCVGVDLEGLGPGLVQNITLESGEFIDLGSHFRDSRFHMLRHLELILMPCWDDSLKLSGEAKNIPKKY